MSISEFQDTSLRVSHVVWSISSQTKSLTATRSRSGRQVQPGWIFIDFVQPLRMENVQRENYMRALHESLYEC